MHRVKLIAAYLRVVLDHLGHVSGQRIDHSAPRSTLRQLRWNRRQGSGVDGVTQRRRQLRRAFRRHGASHLSDLGHRCHYGLTVRVICPIPEQLNLPLTPSSGFAAIEEGSRRDVIIRKLRHGRAIEGKHRGDVALIVYLRDWLQRVIAHNCAHGGKQLGRHDVVSIAAFTVNRALFQVNAIFEATAGTRRLQMPPLIGAARSATQSVLGPGQTQVRRVQVNRGEISHLSGGGANLWNEIERWGYHFWGS